MSKANVYVFKVCFALQGNGGVIEGRQCYVAALDVDGAIAAAIDSLADPKLTIANVALVERSVVLNAIQRSIFADVRALEAAALERAS